ncbi:MAG: hypothetical protein ACE5KI_07390 [Dehalococcoidia bacterium]
MLTGTLMLSRGSFFSFEMVSDSLHQVEQRIGERARTRLMEVSTTTVTSSQVKLVLKNDGQVALRDFAHWDVVFQYYDSPGNYLIEWLPFSSAATPGDDQWVVDAIYLDEQAATPEIFNPGILDPGEEIVILAGLKPKVGNNTNGLATVSTPNGVAISMNFSN